MSRRDHGREKEHWGSSVGVVLAVAGGAIGLGNFLRFPGQVATYGGGAFMIPYFISMLVVAIPLALSEWALGRNGGRRGYHSPPGIYRAAANGKTFWGVCGGVSALAPLVICMYYVFIESWCLLYALQYLGGCLRPLGLGFSLFPSLEAGLKLSDSASYEAFFAQFVGMSGGDGSLFRNIGASPLLLATIGCALANFTLIYFGIARGIERFCKIATPVLLLCSLLVILRVATLGNPTGVEGQSFVDGLGFMWNPSRPLLDESGAIVGQTSVWTALANPEVWLAATAQIFFSVSICLCAITSYASYVKPNDDIALSGLTAVAANEFCEVALGGLMTIPAAIMFLGVAAAGNFDSTFAMGFVVLPNVFGLMAGGEFFGFLFFSLLFLAGLTSSISLVQPTVALTQEAFRWSRGVSVAATLAVNLVGIGVVCWFTRNLAALDSFDFWLANFTPFVFALLQTFLVAWVWGADKMTAELKRGAKIQPPRALGFVVKYVSTPYLAVIFALWLWNNLGSRLAGVAQDRAAQVTLAFIGLLTATLIVVSLKASRRWRREEENAAQARQTEENSAIK
jgi:SNF family Na+-dependent transporter